MLLFHAEIDRGCRTAVEDSELAVGLLKFDLLIRNQRRRQCGEHAARLDGMKTIVLDRGLAIGSTFRVHGAKYEALTCQESHGIPCVWATDSAVRIDRGDKGYLEDPRLPRYWLCQVFFSTPRCRLDLL